MARAPCLLIAFLQNYFLIFYLSDLDRIFVRFWSDFWVLFEFYNWSHLFLGPVWVRFGSNSGRILVGFRSNSGPILVQFWSNSGPILVQFWSNSGSIVKNAKRRSFIGTPIVK
jgi:hypothetical protein